jgi:hypothetical protein
VRAAAFVERAIPAAIKSCGRCPAIRLQRQLTRGVGAESSNYAHLVQYACAVERFDREDARTWLLFGGLDGLAEVFPTSTTTIRTLHKAVLAEGEPYPV